MKGRADFYEEGGWNAVCFICGRKRKASQLARHWQGHYVCPEHPGLTRHPQDFVRGVPDRQAPPWTQPPPEDIFIAFCSLAGQSSVCDYAEADCAVCDADLLPGAA